MRWWLLLVAACGRIGFDPAGSSSPTDSNAADAPTSDLVVWLSGEVSFDSGDPVDVAGANLVSCAGPCPTQEPGKRGQAYRFDGNSYLLIPQVARFDPLAGFTAAAWINLDSLGLQSFTCFVALPVGAGDADTFAVCVENTNGDTHWEIGNQTEVFGLDGPSLPLDTWQHMALTWDSTSKVFRSYLNGARIGMRTVTTVEVDSTPIHVGGDSNFGGPVYQIPGMLDDVQIYRRALDDAEIAALVQ